MILNCTQIHWQFWPQYLITKVSSGETLKSFDQIQKKKRERERRH